ncbi:MAG: tetratricopeptide repeat protein [Bacteroidales bacterium]|nr:tetratricopeptide repeat protein [Bacteroidales bacterium]
MARIIMALIVAGITTVGAPTAVFAADPLTEAQTAFQKRDFATARKLAEQAVAADAQNPDALYLLGQSCLRLRDNTAAEEAFTKLITLAPQLWFAHDGRGDARLKLGKFTESVADFDKALEQNPKFAPEHWRRGIALYYAEKFADGAKQFETHKTANPQDVENAAWHYLCNSHVVGREKARASLIDVTQDRRVPMAEIQKLFAGKLTPADVLARAEKVPADTDAGKEARFYAHLYVGLWYEAEGDAKKAREHLTTAVEDYKISHYMWDVGRAHVELRNKQSQEPKNSANKR